GVIGLALGAAAVCFAAPLVRACADAMVLESVWASLAETTTRRLAGRPAWLQRLTWTAIGLTEHRLGVRLAQFAPVDYVGGLGPRPVLLLTGTDDPCATPAALRQLSARCPGPCETGLVPHAGHEDLCEAGGQWYQRRVLEFLECWLR